MRRRDTGAEVHVPYGPQSHAPVLRQSGERTKVQRVEGAQEQPRHGIEARPFRMPPQKRKKPTHRKSYSIADILLAIVVAACVVSVIWGYAVIYQVGYHKAEAYYSQEEVVRHA